MKKTTLRILTGLAFVASATLTFAQGTAFTYQGVLQDGGAPANGVYDLTFTVFDTAVNGNLIAGPITNSATAASNGLFTVTLDFGNGVLEGSALWLELAVQTNGSTNFTTIAPRQALTPHPARATGSC